MCTLAIYWHVSREYPLVVAANRDEFLDRPSLGPAFLGHDPWVVGGKDLIAGGTWLGVNGRRMVAGLLNRRSNTPPDPRRRSRGLLCLDVLRRPSAGAAIDALLSLDAAAFNPFNLLIASPQEAHVISNSSGAIEVHTFAAGLHVLTNLAVNDVTCPRIAKSVGSFEAAGAALRRGDLEAFRGSVQRVLADHSTPLDPRSQGPPNNLCVHLEQYGTRSSSLLVYAAEAQRFRFWHVDGPPCRGQYAEISLPSSLS